MDILKQINMHLLSIKKRNDFYRGFLKIIVQNEANTEKREEMLQQLKELIDSLEQDKSGEQNHDEAFARVIGEINYKYNPCRTSEEMWVDIQAESLVYYYNNQRVCNKIKSMEKAARSEGYEGESLTHLHDKLLKEREELLTVANEFGEFKETEAEYRESLVDAKRLLQEKIRDLEKTEGIIMRINDVERENRHRRETVMQRYLKEDKEVTEKQITEAASKAVKLKALTDRLISGR